MALAGYIGEFEIVDDRRSGKIVVNLLGRINKCGVISPRFDITLGKLEQWISYLLPSRQFGHIVLTTSYGIMDHHEARRKKTGGKVLGFCKGARAHAHTHTKGTHTHRRMHVFVPLSCVRARVFVVTLPCALCCV